MASAELYAATVKTIKGAEVPFSAFIADAEGVVAGVLSPPRGSARPSCAAVRLFYVRARAPSLIRAQSLASSLPSLILFA
jgi:hypothetical protein